MQHSEREKGTMTALMGRLAKERLPRLIAIKEYVDRGEPLSSFDVEYLEHALKDANDNRQHVLDFPEYADIVGNVARLYGEIMAKAVENEQKR